MEFRATIIFLIFLVQRTSSQKQAVISVIELSRHGARAPPNFEEVAKKILHGTEAMQLTHMGYTQHFLLGEALRKKYSMLSTENLKTEIISSPKQRCIFSTIAQVHGLFPEAKIEIDSENNNYDLKVDQTPPGYHDLLESPKPNTKINQTVKVSIINPIEDTLFHARECAVIQGHNANKASKQSFLHASERTEVVDLVKKKSVLFPFTEQEIEMFCSQVIDRLRSKFKYVALESDWNFPEPTKFDYRFVENLVQFLIPIRLNLSDEESKDLIFDEVIEKLIKKEVINHFYSGYIGEFPDQILLVNDLISKVIQYSTIQNSFGLYVGHDSNIVFALLNLLDHEFIRTEIDKALTDKNLFNFFIPPFASNIIFETSKHEDGKSFIKIIYNGTEITKGFKNQLIYTANKGIDINDFLGYFSSKLNNQELDCTSINFN